MPSAQPIIVLLPSVGTKNLLERPVVMFCICVACQRGGADTPSTYLLVVSKSLFHGQVPEHGQEAL
jgi:hypothetical protein